VSGQRSPAELWHRIRSGEDPVAFGAVVIVVAVAAGFAWLWAGARSGGVPAASAAPGSSLGTSSPGGPPSALTAHVAGPTTSTTAPLAVHVAGAVARPGLYHLPPGSRVADALGRAGGKLPAADLDRLNLAAKLVDGQKILVLRRGEPVPVDLGAVTGQGGGAGEGTASTGPIDLNTADLAALDSLPGVGPATARAILEERARRGGFRSTRDLLRVPGIGEGRFARLKDLVRV
jgi:competence protein ComEA